MAEAVVAASTAATDISQMLIMTGPIVLLLRLLMLPTLQQRTGPAVVLQRFFTRDCYMVTGQTVATLLLGCRGGAAQHRGKKR